MDTVEELDLPIQIAASSNIGEPSLVRGLVVYRIVHFFIISDQLQFMVVSVIPKPVEILVFHFL
jgi:hypothetical protein